MRTIISLDTITFCFVTAHMRLPPYLLTCNHGRIFYQNMISFPKKIPSIDRIALYLDGFLFARNVQNYWLYRHFFTGVGARKLKTVRFLQEMLGGTYRSRFSVGEGVLPLA